MDSRVEGLLRSVGIEDPWAFVHQNPEATEELVRQLQAGKPAAEEPPTDAILQGDALPILRGWRAESFDLIATDPPYESLMKWLGVGTTGRMGLRRGGGLKHRDGSRAFFPTIPNADLPLYAREFYRLLKPDSHCYVFCDHETLFPLKEAMELAGFKFWKPLVWDKVNPGMGYHYRATYELVAFFEKGKRKLKDLSITDVLHEKRIVGGYPTEKPQRLFEVFISQSTEPGARVLDPFVGAGTCAAAAHRLGRRYVGVDVLLEAVALSRARVSQKPLAFADPATGKNEGGESHG